jgi:cell division protein FtsZ
VFSSETASPAASAAGGAAPAPTAEKPVEEDNSDNGYYDQLMAMLNKRR